MGAIAGVSRAARAGPEIAAEEAVLDALAETSLGAVVDIPPVASGELLHVFVAAAAIDGSDGRRTGCARGDGGRLDQAARHVRAPRSVADLGCAAQHIVAGEIIAAVVGVGGEIGGGIELDPI